MWEPERVCFRGICTVMAPGGREPTFRKIRLPRPGFFRKAWRLNTEQFPRKSLIFPVLGIPGIDKDAVKQFIKTGKIKFNRTDDLAALVDYLYTL